MAKLTIAERVAVLMQSMTQREVAKRIGVSVRTVRRWSNEGTTPLPSNRAKLVKKSTDARRELIKRGSPDIPVPPKTKVVKDTTEITPRLTIFEQTIGNVKRFFDLAKWYRDNTNAEVFRLLLKTPGGSPEYPATKFFSTSWRKLKTVNSKATDFDLATFIVDSYNMPFVSSISKIFVS